MVYCITAQPQKPACLQEAVLGSQGYWRTIQVTVIAAWETKNRELTRCALHIRHIPGGHAQHNTERKTSWRQDSQSSSSLQTEGSILWHALPTSMESSPWEILKFLPREHSVSAMKPCCNTNEVHSKNRQLGRCEAYMV